MAQGILISSNVVNPGGKYIISAYGWQGGHTIKIQITNTTTSANITLNDIGCKTFAMQVPTNIIPGSYVLSARDEATGDAATFDFRTTTNPIDPPVCVFQTYTVPLYSMEDDAPVIVYNRRSFLVKNIGHKAAQVSIFYHWYYLLGSQNDSGVVSSFNLQPGELATYSSNTLGGPYDIIYTLVCTDLANGYSARSTDQISVRQLAGVGGTFSGTGPGASGQGESIDVIQPLLGSSSGGGTSVYDYGDLVSGLVVDNITETSARITATVSNTTATKSGDFKAVIYLRDQAGVELFNHAYPLTLAVGQGNQVQASVTISTLQAASGYSAGTFAENTAENQPLSLIVTRQFNTLQPGTGGGGGGGTGGGGVLGGISTWFNNLSSTGKLGLLAALGLVAVGAGSKRGGGNQTRVIRA